jgi:hypothetical protein
VDYEERSVWAFALHEVPELEPLRQVLAWLVAPSAGLSPQKQAPGMVL